ncbi:MAG: hypothetical protein WBA02_05600 [Jannaschia helgolandensis]|jgi:hypothetical protein|uniref:hypothetical protein n=1 Tax=Jannaschia helgolandensis TaxID=188906 RepID=UPI003C70D39F
MKMFLAKWMEEVGDALVLRHRYLCERAIKQASPQIDCALLRLSHRMMDKDGMDLPCSLPTGPNAPVTVTEPGSRRMVENRTDGIQ